MDEERRKFWLQVINRIVLGLDKVEEYKALVELTRKLAKAFEEIGVDLMCDEVEHRCKLWYKGFEFDIWDVYYCMDSCNEE